MDGAKKSPQAIERTGQQWGQYRIISSLEQGRFSNAYLGKHVITSRQCVIDILPMPLTTDQAEVFLRQASGLAQLVHPHILHLVDAGVENFSPFVVLDYMAHIPLREQYHKGAGQPLGKLLPYLEQVVAALQYAHDKGFLHKNLRPENVLLGWSNGILLYDFAIDVVTQNEQYQNYQRSRDPIDAMVYRAPELMQRQESPASDQYALAVMTYEWLCGTPPFQGTYFELANQQRNMLPPPLRQKEPTVSSEVETVVMTALAKDPARRFGSVTAFMKALRQAHNPDQVVPATPSRPVQSMPSAEPSSVPPAPPTGRISLPSSLDPAAATARSEKPRSPVISSSVTTSSPHTLHASPASALSSTPSVTPVPEPLAPRRNNGHSTRRAFFVAAAGIALVGGGGSYLLWRKTHPANAQGNTGPAPEPPATTFTPVNPDAPQMLYTGHTDRVNGVSWSPDGTKIASASDDKTVLICDLRGKTLLTYKGHKDHVLAVAWSPDGKLLASASADKTVQIWDAVTGKLVQTYTRHAAAVNAVAWSSDSRLVASGGDDRMVHTWFPRTGEVFFFYGLHGEHTNVISAVAWSPDSSKIASASWDKTVQVFAAVPIRTKNILLGDRIVKYTGNSDEVYTVGWSPDGQILASGGAGNAVLFCSSLDGSDVKVGKEKLQPRPHRAAVRSLSWSPDGNFLVSSDDNKEVREWDVRIANPDRDVFSFENHTDAVYAAAWAPVAGSKQVASAGADRTVQVWTAKNA